MSTRLLRVGALAIVFSTVVSVAQEHDVLCDGGSGTFQFEFRNEVKVWVGGEKQGGFNARKCQATLSWGKQTEAVASGAAQVDIDLLGAQFTSGEPVVAVSVQQQSSDCCLTYKIYSLSGSPKLLRTIAGGGYFSAADTDLDGDVEIWTNDRAAVNGFDGLSAAEMDFVPTYVLRMEHGRLVDASAEFQQFYDGIIADVGSNKKSEGWQRFKSSDGRLQAKTNATADELVRLHELRTAKIQALEIVWAYLYSGREQEAWKALEEMWPAEDVSRIHSEIVRARERGIRAQLDGVAAEKRRKRRAFVYGQSESVPAQAIMMRIYPGEGVSETSPEKNEVHVELLIDSAGKVREVTLLGSTQKAESVVIDPSGKPRGKRVAGANEQMEEQVLRSVTQWKFKPALKDGKPVASRLHTGVWLQR